MISEKYRFIYLHVPKTGGNAIQSVLLDFSDDHMVRARHQDGVNRFNISGPRTPNKHARLSAYKATLRDSEQRYRILISVRHPFTRCVSAYFSPNRWMRQTDSGSWVSTEPTWDETAFLDMVQCKSITPATKFLSVGGVVYTPDLVIKFETLQEDFRRATAVLNLPLQTLPHVNRSTASQDLVTSVLSSRNLRDAVEQEYRADMEFFDYQPFMVAGGQGPIL